MVTGYSGLFHSSTTIITRFIAGTELPREVKINSVNFATELSAECPRRSYSRNNFSNARAADAYNISRLTREYFIN